MTITVIPPLDRTSPTFRAECDTYFASSIPTLTTELNALATDLTTKQGLATNAAISTAQDKIDTAADRVQTGLDRVQTGQDRAAAAASAATIGTTAAFSDANPIAKNAADNTKQIKFNLSAITPGTTPEVAWPNKSGMVAMTTDGGLVFLGEIILASAAASIDFLNIFSSAYDRYMITGEDVRVVSSSGGVRLRFATAGSVDSTVNAYGASTMGTALALSSTSLYLGDTNSSANGGTFFEFVVHDVNSTTNTNKRTRMVGMGATTLGAQFHGAYYRVAGAAALSGFSIINDTGANFATGAKIRVYGFKKT